MSSTPTLEQHLLAHTDLDTHKFSLVNTFKGQSHEIFGQLFFNIKLIAVLKIKNKVSNL